MFHEMVKRNVDALGARMEFGKTSQFKRARVVLKIFVIDMRLRTDETKLLGLGF